MGRKMTGHKIGLIKLREKPELKNTAVSWFSEKWGIPAEEYQKSIDECIDGTKIVPQWYIATDETGNIIGGAGVIENDFHSRVDLAPNLCALFVEPQFRGNRISERIIDMIKNDMKSSGLSTLYLITDHTSFYERYGWEFFCMTDCCDGTRSRIYKISL